MPLKFARIFTGILAGSSFLTLAGPVIGELVATVPPPFPSWSNRALVKLGVAFEEVSFPTTDGLTLYGWFIPAELPDAPGIVYAPGTAQDQRSGLALVPAFHQAGYHVLLFSYRGHGHSEGNRLGMTYGEAESKDVDAAVGFLSQQKGIARVGVIGYSLGAASTILSAARNPQIGAVVAVAPYNCIAEVWRTNRPPLVPTSLLEMTLWLTEKRKGFSRDNVCPLNVVGDIAPRPLLLIHGTADRRITEGQIRHLYMEAGSPKRLWLVDGATHSSIRDVALEQLAPDVIAFFDQALRASE